MSQTIIRMRERTPMETTAPASQKISIKLKPGDRVEFNRNGAKITFVMHDSSSFTVEEINEHFSPIADLIVGFEKELEVNLISSSKKNRLKQAVLDLGSAEAAANPESGSCRYAILVTVLQSMRDLKQSDLDSFKSLRKKLIEESTNDAYWGTIFEVLTAGMLYRKGLNFRCGVPDFQVRFGEKIVNIECTSIRYGHTNIGQYSPADFITGKLRRIDGKENKPYAKKDTLLMVDITQMIEWRRILELSNDIESYFPSDSNYGSILLVANFLKHDDDNGMFMVNGYYQRHYHYGPSTLMSFLNKYYGESEKKYQPDAMTVI